MLLLLRSLCSASEEPSSLGFTNCLISDTATSQRLIQKKNHKALINFGIKNCWASVCPGRLSSLECTAGEAVKNAAPKILKKVTKWRMQSAGHCFTITETTQNLYKNASHRLKYSFLGLMLALVNVWVVSAATPTCNLQFLNPPVTNSVRTSTAFANGN